MTNDEQKAVRELKRNIREGQIKIAELGKDLKKEKRRADNLLEEYKLLTQ